jgi:hypothetical protein
VDPHFYTPTPFPPPSTRRPETWLVSPTLQLPLPLPLPLSPALNPYSTLSYLCFLPYIGGRTPAVSYNILQIVRSRIVVSHPHLTSHIPRRTIHNHLPTPHAEFHLMSPVAAPPSSLHASSSRSSPHGRRGATSPERPRGGSWAWFRAGKRSWSERFRCFAMGSVRGPPWNRSALPGCEGSVAR